VIAAMIALQTIGQSSLMPSTLRGAVAIWERRYDRRRWARPLAICMLGGLVWIIWCTVPPPRSCCWSLVVGPIFERDASVSLPRCALSRRRRREHQLASAACTAFFMYASADCLMQCLRAQRNACARVAINLRRMTRTGITSALLSGCLAVIYFGWLERTIALPLAWREVLGVRMTALASVLGKVGVDVGVYEPCYDTLYITLQALLRGEGLTQAWEEVQLKVLRVWAMAPRYWIFADALNFSLVPLRLRPMTNALLSIPWSMYISSVANANVERAPAAN